MASSRIHWYAVVMGIVILAVLTLADVLYGFDPSTRISLGVQAALTYGTVLLALFTYRLGTITRTEGAESRTAAGKGIRSYIDEEKRSRQLLSTIELLGEYRRMREYREWVDSSFPDRREGFLASNKEMPLSELRAEPDKQHLMPLSHFYDQVGIEVFADPPLVDRQIILEYMGGSAARHWELIGPFILNERKKRKEKILPYQHYFEKLARLAMEELKRTGT